MSTPFSNRIIAFLKTPLGIVLGVILAGVPMCLCGTTVLGALITDPEPKQSQSAPPPAVVSIPSSAAPSPTEVITTPPVVPTVVEPPPQPTTARPPAPRPTRTTSSPKPQPACHPNYSVCLPIVADLDCGEISQRNFQVIGGNDPYRLDADNDGIACEKS